MYICYDNCEKMNTGVPRSSATPMGATTTTTPVGEQSYGRQGNLKDLARIMVAHNIGYVAQASIHDPVDLSEKLKKAIELDGPAFINLLSPCIPGWKIAPDMAVETARLGVECKYWPLYEVIDGEYKINYTPKKEMPVTEWMFLQGRFKHLSKPEHSDVVDAIQKEVERNWNWIVRQAEMAELLAGPAN